MPGTSRPAPPPAWVNRLTLAVLTLMLTYAIVGLPEFDRDAALSTDYVNPLNRIIWLGLLGLAAPVALARWRPALRLTLGIWPLLLLYAYFALSTTWALDPDASTRRILFTAVQLVLTIILLSGLKRAADLHVVIAAVCTVAALADIAVWAVMPGYAMTSEGFAGMQLQKNQTGLLMMYGCLSGTTAFFLVQSRLLKAAILGAVLMMAGLLVATKSTTSQSIVLMAPVVIPAILVVVRMRRPTIWAIAMAIPFAIALAFFAYLAWCGLANADPWLPLRGVTFTDRKDLWIFAISQIGQRPWLGTGYASLWAINPAVQPSLKSDMWFGTYAIINEAHEGYLDLWATTGLVGLVAGLLVVLRTIVLAFRAVTRTEPAAQAWRSGRLAYPTAVFHLTMLIGLLVHNFTESNLFSNNSVLAVAFTVAALDLEKWRIATWAPARTRYPRPVMPARRAAVANQAGQAALSPGQ